MAEHFEHTTPGEDDVLGGSLLEALETPKKGVTTARIYFAFETLESARTSLDFFQKEYESFIKKHEHPSLSENVSRHVHSTRSQPPSITGLLLIAGGIGLHFVEGSDLDLLFAFVANFNTLRDARGQPQVSRLTVLHYSDCHKSRLLPIYFAGTGSKGQPQEFQDNEDRLVDILEGMMTLVGTVPRKSQEGIALDLETEAWRAAQLEMEAHLKKSANVLPLSEVVRPLIQLADESVDVWPFADFEKFFCKPAHLRIETQRLWPAVKGVSLEQ